LPVRNAESTLAACLRSLQRQTAPDWDCIIVDDGSQDASLTYAQWFAARDSRLVVVATPHQGLVAALNTGLSYCRGRFIARMDADDLMHRRRLASQLQALDDDPNLAAVGSHVRIFPRRLLRDGRRAYERWLNSIDTPRRVCEDAFVECPIAHPTLMIRRSVMRTQGYRDCGWPEDYDLILRLLAAQHTIGVVPQRLLSWRDAPQRLSRTSPAYAIERFTACKAAFLASTFLAHTHHYILWGYGETGKALRRALVPHDKRPVYIVELHPRRLGKTNNQPPYIPQKGKYPIHGLPVL
jgi:glycosyltransferase involved in cell wall biosynthesis